MDFPMMYNTARFCLPIQLPEELKVTQN